MTIHVFNVAPLRPPAGGEVPTQSLVVVAQDRVFAVDAGLPESVFRDPKLISFERHFLRIPSAPEFALVNRLSSIGIDPMDLSDIVLTHLHSEHAAGIVDFPHATIHVSKTELDVAQNNSLRSRISYRHHFFAHGPNWRPHDGTATWQGIRGCSFVTSDVVLVPLPGHTLGHCGVAVRHTSGDWILHTGDAGYGDPVSGAHAAFPLAQYERVSVADRGLQRKTSQILKNVAAQPDVHLVSSHRHPSRLPSIVQTPYRESFEHHAKS